MKPVPHHHRVIGTPVIPALAVAVLFGAFTGLIVPASAQTFSSSYTSTAPKDCRVGGLLQR
jgi:hypothetical protein